MIESQHLQQRGYEVIECIYSTGSCTVHRGVRAADRLPLAIKIQHFPSHEDLQKCNRELWALYKLQSHPLAVKLLDYFTEDHLNGSCANYLVLEWVSTDLMKEIKRRREEQSPLTESELLRIACDLISVLAYSAHLGVCHRDIKPHNILFDHSTQRVKLADFGSVTMNVWTTDKVTATIVGTPAFMSPELISSLWQNAIKITHSVVKSDVYSLGMTLLTLAKLEFPSRLIQIDQLATAIPQELSLLGYSEKVKEMLRDMLNLNAEERLSFQQLQEKYCVEPAEPMEAEEAKEAALQPVEPNHEVLSLHDNPISPQCELVKARGICRKCSKFIFEDPSDPKYPNLTCANCSTFDFCGPNCLYSYVSDITKQYSCENGSCDECQGIIPRADLEEACGGARRYRNQISEFLGQYSKCSVCLEKKWKKRLQCGCYFCDNCIKASSFVNGYVYCIKCERYNTKR